MLGGGATGEQQPRTVQVGFSAAKVFALHLRIATMGNNKVSCIKF